MICLEKLRDLSLGPMTLFQRPICVSIRLRWLYPVAVCQAMHPLLRIWAIWRSRTVASRADCGPAFDAGGEVSDAVHAPGYGRLNDAVREAMAARHEALLLDPVYTGKAMAGLVAHVRAGRIAAGSRVLFLHTGGLPALFAYADKLGSWLTKAPWAPPR